MRIVAFVGSPLEVDEKEVSKLAKRLKKENVQIDIINFGETVSSYLFDIFLNKTLNLPCCLWLNCKKVWETGKKLRNVDRKDFRKAGSVLAQ